MKAKFFKWPLAMLVFTIAILPTGVASAQKAQKGKQAAAPTKPDEDAYKIFFNARTGPPETQIQLGEDFIAKFPMSTYLGQVYGSLCNAYSAVGQEDKMFDAGQKALEINPDNVDVLSLLAMAIPRRVRGNTPDAAQKMQKAEEYGHHAVELIPNIPKPPDLDDATFEKTKNDKLAMAHSGLGLIDINHQKFEDARTELMLAVQLSSNPDPVDYFLLGNADSKASYYNDAAAAFGKCATTGPLTAQCKSGEETAKKDATTKLGR
ncbi:MAG: tetratricopeptide repeat protein [Candidatus Acidiferrales bacterium]|jgi:tetratricopeptide (TPR) repeat protein